MCEYNECPTCTQDWVANTDYECGCCGRPASEHIRVTSLCRILRETQQREHALLVEIEDAKTTADLWMKHAKHADDAAADLKAELADTRRHWKEELAVERALADRLHGALDALDYNLAFAENTAHGSLGEKITAMRAIALPAIEAWKEARSE